MANNQRKSIDLLPSFFRTEKNNKFLSSTLDQLISPPELTRIDAFAGSKNTPNYKSTDQYVPETSAIRAAYQLEPALVIKGLNQEIKKAFGLDDLLNQINNKGGNSSNLDRVFDPKFYSYDPKIDWDKFINFREYFWLPSGPSTINISGDVRPSIVEYTITDAEDKKQFLFNGLTPTQSLILYRGTTYIFNVDSIHNFYIKYTNDYGSDNAYSVLENNGIKKGQIIFTVSFQTPENLYYVSGTEQLSTGQIFIKDPAENTAIDVEDQIIGKKYYTSSTGIKFVNGLKIKFNGLVFPEQYRDLEYIVEGVGSSIKLVQFNELDTPDSIAETFNTRFDGTNFDQFPFDNFKNIPLVPEYVTINKSSKDKNPWSRYNRWFHSDVIKITAEATGSIPVYPAEYRALRPIIEFASDIQLHNFGSVGLKNIDVIDNTVTDAFNQVENTAGYYIDGVLLEEGFRIIFNADTNPQVRNKIYRAHFTIIGDNTKLDLVQEDDIIESSVSVLVKQGRVNAGTSWHFNTTSWTKSQQRAYRNQSPLFELYDNNGNSFSERNANTNFAGNKIFGYSVGAGINDTILGFPLLYKNVGVEGTYLFKNFFATDEFLIVENNIARVIPTSSTFFKIDNVLSNVWTLAEEYTIPKINNVYEPPVNLTNNPLNESIVELTLTEISDHIKSMTLNDPNFTGVFPGISNIKDLPNISRYGSKLVSNINPLSFSQLFITDEEHNLINATRLVGENYQQFKLNLIKLISSSNQTLTPLNALDAALTELNQNKTTSFPYYYSDMIPFGTGSISARTIVSDTRTKIFKIPGEFEDRSLSTKGVLVYLNSIQLIKEIDYTISNNNVIINGSLEIQDILEIKFYPTTAGGFVPPTPTKLGLYPKYEPKMYLDDTFAGEPAMVLQGHDGSITLAFNDYRDEILLEYEKRVFNNLKTQYEQDLFDVNTILPSAYRSQEYNYREIFNAIHKDFLRWKSTFSVEADKNLTFDINNHRTYNFSTVTFGDTTLPGHWRAIYKMFFDTDRPHSHPWEMLGFSMKPVWWEDEYGVAPYTSDNIIMWTDISQGKILYGDRQGIDINYVRPNLLTNLPVTSSGSLVDVRNWGIIGNSEYIDNVDNDWKFGDIGPAENSWRRSSYWPFAVQIISALTKPASYASLLFDTSRMVKNIIGQYVYAEDNLFLNHTKVLVPYDKINDSLVLTSGYSVYVVEAGLIRNSNYVDQLKEELQYSSLNLMHKVGGFISKDKIEVVIDSVNPNSISPGVLLPVEDYTIHFNVSNPIRIVNISGFVIQKHNNGFILRGYDRDQPFFTIFKGLHEKGDTYITVGGNSEEYVMWSSNTYYPVGKVISYDNTFYRSNNNHDSGSTFNPLNYVKILSLPIVGGITIAYPSFFENEPIEIAYGTFFNTIQEVTDVIAGYGKWLEFSGFIFDELNSDLGEILDWRLSIKEFIYWSGQNWAENSVIALSPFANSLKFTFQDSVVDNVLDSFYDYNILKADGYGIAPATLSISRERGSCTITSKNDQEGIFFASLRLVQKEHAIILNNTSRFNDVIYDVDTGYRQRRIRLIGFKTANWNGDYFSPGFVYDSAKVYKWLSNKDYQAGDVVEYGGNYYSLDRNLSGKPTFDFTDWNKLGKKPVAQLIPNFEYKINQFEDFYSLDIDNFDVSQQQLAQQLTGYSPRVYLSNIFFNQLAQYKFFQGFIKEKGTRNALDKLVRASVHNLQGKLDFKEEWAFRIGTFGAYSSLDEIEFPLQEFKMIDNSQLIKFVNEDPVIEYDSTNYITPLDLTITPIDYSVDNTFKTTKEPNNLNPFVLPVAGYIRLDDVDYTVRTKEDLFNFEPGKTVRLGETIWVGFDDNTDWNAYRYARLNSAVTAAFDVVAGKQIGFLTDKYHGLAVGDIVAITRFNDEVNGIYKIIEVPKLDQFIVETDKFAPPDTNMYGVLFKFLPARFNNFDELATQPFVADFKIGKKIWIDQNENGFWEVYEKIDNYAPYVLNYPFKIDQPGFGFRIVSKEESNLLLVSAPNYSEDSNNNGRIYVYTHSDGVIRGLGNYGINNSSNQFYDNGSNEEIGKSSDFDGINQVVVTGAPFASNVRAASDVESSGTAYVSAALPGRSLPGDGIVIISTASEESGIKHHVRLACQEVEAGMNFGHSVFISTTASTKILLVGAPGKDSNAGAVYSYDVNYSISFDGTLTQVTSTTTSQIKLPTENLLSGYRFGELIAGDKNGNRIAVTVPGYDNSSGAVHIYENTTTSTITYSKVQELKWNDVALGGKIQDDGQFGYDIDMDDSGNWLFISAYNATDRVLETGKVVIYKWTGEEFEFSQILDNPSSAPGMKFGHSIETDSSGNILTISALGSNYFDALTFDEASTTFDSESTKLGTLIRNSGSAYIYNRYGDKFIFADELFNSNVKENSDYGYAVSVNRNSIYVSAPTYRVGTETEQRGNIHIWDTIDPAINSWKLLRSQEEIVDVSNFKQIKTIDTFDQSVIDYIEIIDPVKGKIPQLADQEIRYKTPFDPAIYNTGTNETANIEPARAWVDDNVGELWWDLSSIKYVWYEQGEDDYRKNAWGSLFPGCTIEVYEWVKSEYLPERWATEADTTAGLAADISGQPKYIDNSAYSTRQVYSSVSDLYTNVYYFWVKNTVIIPKRQGRVMSAYDVALLISDPKLYGLKYIQPLSKNSLSVVNVKGDLINDRVLLNIQIDEIDNQRNKHTEWLLLEEESSRSLPNFMLEKKMIDSLLGRDALGNLVPDPNLSDRLKYGIEIRPRQSMFKNRFAALRNFVEFANNVFKENLIIDYFSLKTLNSKEEIPDVSFAEYDIVVDDLDQMNELTTTFIRSAQLDCEIVNGKISNVIILDSGIGYGKLDPKKYNADNEVITWRGPVVEIRSSNVTGLIETEVNNNGEVIFVNIVDAGQGHLTSPELIVRPYTVLVKSDSESRGLWSKYMLVENELIKIQTQSYNTSLYWDVVDWVSPEYNQFKKITATYELPYELSKLELLPGDYVKINNNGNGRFLILKKLALGEVGKFNGDFDIVYSEKGTIKIKDIIWKTNQSQFGWDQTAPYDNTFWDQTPDTEISKIIEALRDDLFINSLKVYWNKAFFACVKYALTEQKFVDWAFKTSFISVENKAGELIQRPVYKFQDTQWYESYLKEIKPYHTNIRNYTLNYSITEPSSTFVTDFDLPVAYNSTTDKYEPLTENNPLVVEYPYKGWYDNKTLFVDSIVIDAPGSQYVEQPIVQIISAPGDSVVRNATAVAYISAGSVYAIEVTDPGEGYKLTPSILLTGGTSDLGITAKASVRMANGKVRSNFVGIKFDRISSTKQIGDKTVTDTFIASGSVTEFELSWPANPDKNDIDLKINGISVPFSNYDVEDFVKDGEYKKTYTKLILKTPPAADVNVTITYKKSFDIYTAYDRIEDYFLTAPKDSPGKNSQENHAQLMKGMEYPGTTLLTEPLWSNYTWDAVPFDSVSWNKLNFGSDDLDATITGGDLTTSTLGIFASAAGINPEDIILDGDAFISPYRSYGPEELVPGEVKETLGISVFARELSGSPMIYTQFSKAIAGVETIIPLKITPPSRGSVRLTYNRTVLKGVIGDEYLTSENVYRIDFDEKIIYVKSQDTDGDISVTYMDVGGSNFISMNHSYSEGSTTASVLGDCQFDQVNSVYVTLDGNRVTDTVSTNTFYYQLSESVPGIDRRAKVTIYGLGVIDKKTLTAAFFGSSYKGFSEVYEQLIDNLPAGNRAITLIQPPGALGPITANSIVEVNGQRIIPPNTTYYEITNVNQLTFEISTKEVYPPNTFDKTRIEVYKNGDLIIPVDYYLDDNNNRIIFPTGFFEVGDVLAITAFVDYDYFIRGNILEITERIPLTVPNYVRILTFTNHDSSLIRTEVFEATSTRLYKISRKIVNDNFVWITVGNRTLTSGLDFKILDDGYTAQLASSVSYVESEDVIITSFGDREAGRTVGYRIFKDSLNRQHFKRLAKPFTTYLTQPLMLTDTTIHVADAAVLPDPDVKSNTPGIILIAGERIEYLEKTNNVLSRIKRATLGTGAKEYLAQGTWVIDQGKRQTIPFKETIVTQSVNTSTSTISINTTTIKFTELAALHDQIEVYYGGKLLEKPTANNVFRYVHDASSYYDPVNMTVRNPEFTITGTSITASLVLSFMPSNEVDITLVQRRTNNWYSGSSSTLFESKIDESVLYVTVTPPVMFIKQFEAVSVDQLYYGGDPVLRLDDGTALLLDDGREIKGY